MSGQEHQGLISPRNRWSKQNFSTSIAMINGQPSWLAFLNGRQKNLSQTSCRFTSNLSFRFLETHTIFGIIACTASVNDLNDKHDQTWQLKPPYVRSLPLYSLVLLRIITHQLSLALMRAKQQWFCNMEREHILAAHTRNKYSTEMFWMLIPLTDFGQGRSEWISLLCS